jgi:pimeloyl-ACP methyl ester carboxylesterase
LVALSPAAIAVKMIFHRRLRHTPAAAATLPAGIIHAGPKGMTMEVATQLAHSHDIGIKIGMIYRKRCANALEKFGEQCRQLAGGAQPKPLATAAIGMMDPWGNATYAADAAQRAILFWNTLRERGDNFVQNAISGLKPVLHFDYDTVLDGRSFERPVNYALLKIKPPPGIVIDEQKRPYIIIDPRAGHGPGIGGFKDDSQVGVALRAGHAVYFVIFYRDPEPGQTLIDVCSAEQQFVKKVRSLHPDSEKPTIIGNCQGGWAAMMLAASDPDSTGPVVINGAPMSYWGGAWSEDEGDNPMRYAGGILGGTWLSSFSADLGDGKFDGAHLVQNFEYLNPANSLWDKYYKLYRNVDTEPPRFLEFERWWGGYYLMNREEIEWITRNLFVGNKLFSGDVKSAGGKAFDLRDLKSPIVLFASMGDNITPPQQAFNWVLDIYGSTDEIKARGQVIVGLLHQDIGHLGIFVSGKVAKKEHAQIVSVLEQIELLPPGLYGMEISERRGDDSKMVYDVSFREHQLEELASRLNRFARVDEKPFEAVVAISDFNQRAYELFMQPVVQANANELSARLLREFHPLRLQNWALSQVNPWTWWLAPAAQWVTANRKALDAEAPQRQLEMAASELLSAGLELYRGLRDAAAEATFFSIYANMFSLYLADKHEKETHAAAITDPRELPFVKEALASAREGGYDEAFARVAYLLSRKGEPLPIARLVMHEEKAKAYAEYLPQMPMDQFRRIRGEQEIIARYDPELAFDTLPLLLANRDDRARLLTLLDKLMADKDVQSAQPTPEQLAMLERVRAVLGGRPVRERRLAAIRQA